MTSFQVSVPSKTFLLGEYAVLQGGAALILTTLPRFILLAIRHIKNEIDIQGIHPTSPAGKLIQHHAEFFQNYRIIFIDPHQGLGGFGASGAQFVMAAALKQYVDGKTVNDIELLAEYKKLAWDGEGMPPSGADLIAQLHGGVCYFDKLKKKLKVFSWPFSDLDYCLIHTKNKLATHVHLKQLSALGTEKFEEIIRAGVISLEQKNSKNFIDAIKNYADILQEKNLVTMHTQKILKQLYDCPDILAAKGCGALGADVILILFNKKMRSQTVSWLKEKKLHLIDYGHNVENGLSIKEIDEKIEGCMVTKTIENIILVDPDDNKIGEIDKIKGHQYGMLHRAFSVLIFRKRHGKTETLLQQRNKNKYHGGGLWTNTCCSHPHSGEDLLDAAENRLKDEMGIKVRLNEVGKFHYIAKLDHGMTENEIDHVFIGTYDADEIPINQTEVEDYLWVEVNSLKNELMQYPQKYTPWFKQALDLALASYRKQNKDG